MAGSEREQRLEFLSIKVRDTELLRALRPFFEQQAPLVVDEFYEHLKFFPETAQLLHDRTTVERLKKLQYDYLLRITAGNFDDAYFAERLRIGQAHERVGLSPRWYLAAYSHYLNLFTPLLQRRFANDPERAAASVQALTKVFMLDASLAMDAYIASDRYRQLQQLQSIVNDSADVIFMLDNEKCFRTWNRAAAHIFGWKADEIIGKHVNLIIPPDRIKAGELAYIDQKIAQHGFCQLETTRLAREGREVPVELTLSMLRDPQGAPLGRSVILRDITDRKRLEEAKLQSERLATIGAMAARLAHEIRNPLSSITLNIELVRDEVETLTAPSPPAGREARTLLSSIDSEVRRIQRVTEDYLQFARLPKLRREQVLLQDLLTQGLSFMGSLFEAAAIKVETTLPADLPPMHVDESQLWQALLNLIRNAIEAMPQGGTLRIEAAMADREVLLRVADTGKGMTPEERSKIFKPFFSTKAGGTGLGLPLTQQIVDEHGGRIECTSTAGKGTVFTIHLPLTKES